MAWWGWNRCFITCCNSEWKHTNKQHDKKRLKLLLNNSNSSESDLQIKAHKQSNQPSKQKHCLLESHYWGLRLKQFSFVPAQCRRLDTKVDGASPDFTFNSKLPMGVNITYCWIIWQFFYAVGLTDFLKCSPFGSFYQRPFWIHNYFIVIFMI